MPFQKGNTLWNHENAKATRFKKGSQPSEATQFKKSYIPWNKGLKGFNAGESHPRWVSDRTKLSNRNGHAGWSNNPLYREWSRLVKTRDNWKCKIADQSCSGQLEAHHILSWMDYPDERYEVNNGITLCHAHHPRKRAEEKRLAPDFQKLVSVSS